MSASNKKMKKKKQSKLKQLFKIPAKVLHAVKDFYMNTILMCDGQMSGYGGGAMGCPTYCPTILPRSFSTTSSNCSNDAELVKMDLRWNLEFELGKSSPAGMVMMTKSYSVGVGRIDEDEVCEFGEEVMVRTRSYADPVTRRRAGIVH